VLCQADFAVTDVLLVHDNKVGSSLPGVNSEGEGKSGLRSYGMPFLVSLDFASALPLVPSPSGRGYQVVDEFYDPAVSGTDAIEDRPGFTALLDLIESNGVRTVLSRT
jgi:hypothetical protein